MTGPLGRPPIDPLSEVAWSRIERGVWARLDASAVPEGRRARRWWLVALPVAAAGAVLALVVGLRGPGGRGGAEPTRLVTGAAPSLASFGDAHVELDAATALLLGHDTEHPTAWIEHGAAWFTVAPRGEHAPFVVRAGDATVRVLGTRFRVARSGELITVEVDHGLVDVQFRGVIASVAAHERWSSERPAQTTRIAAAPSTPSPAASEPPAADPAPGSAAAASEPPAGTSAPGAAPGPSTTPAASPAPRSDSPAPAPGASSSSSSSSIAPAAPRHPAPGAAPATTATASTPGPVDRERAEYDRLAALEARAPDAALTGYLALARGTSPWADPALFAAARLAADRHDRRAAPLLALYLQRFPAGANATDASQLLARLKGDPP